MLRVVRVRILRWFIVTIVIVAALAGGLLTLIAARQQYLVDLALTQVNKRIKGELIIEKSSISLTKNFPYISIALHGARLIPEKASWDTPVCEIERLYVGFDALDLVRQHYNVKRLYLQGGRVTLVRDTTGRLNLLDAIGARSDSTSADSTMDEDMEIDLRKIVVKDASITFADKSTGRTFNGNVDKLSAALTLHKEQLHIALTSGMNLNFKSRTDTTLFRNKRFELDIKADYGLNSSRLSIAEGKFKFQDASFSIDGTADLTEPGQVDLKVSGDEPDFAMLAAFLPGDVKSTLHPFTYDGEIYFNGTIKGELSHKETPLIEISFGCKDAWFINTAADKKVDQLTFKGFYTNGAQHSLRTSELHITNVNARPEKGTFQGNFVFQDFTDLHTLIQINSELELKFIGEFFGIKHLEQTTGKIKLEMDFKELDSIKLPEQSLAKLKEGIQSKLVVEGLSFAIPGYPLPVRDMSLRAEMKDGQITIDSAFLRIGQSDLKLTGQLSDVQALLHDRKKPVTLVLNAVSKSLMLKELFSYDSLLGRRIREEVKDLKLGLTLTTTFNEILHPTPLPRGQLELTELSASFARYPHKFTDLSAIVVVNDTLVRLRHFKGLIDNSDFQFSGRVTNYKLWFDKVRKGKSQLAFDFKSTHFAMQDILGRTSRKFVPEGYRQEEASNVWLRAKVDLRYDTVFHFARAEIANITGSLKKHNFQVKDIHGLIKYGAGKVLVADSLTGTIGRSDFDLNMRLYAGADVNVKKKTNFLTFRSKFFDADELTGFDLADSHKVDSGRRAAAPSSDSSSHAKSFNIFKIPFDHFNVSVDVGKVKYNGLWLKDLGVRMRFQDNQHIFVDTVGVRVADGTLGLKGELNGSDPANINFQSTINVDQVDLEKMLIKLEHLGEDVVINRNIKGRISGQITSDLQVHPNMMPLLTRTSAKLNVRIYNGTLVDFAPLQAMATYFKDKNLRLVRFDTLKNELTFSNGTLTIPTMNINSSLGYIQVSGKQSLNLNMEYYVRVPMKLVTKAGMSALFGSKPDEVAYDQVDEIEYSDKDKKVMYMNLKVTGTPTDYKVKLGKDKKGAVR